MLLRISVFAALVVVAAVQFPAIYAKVASDPEPAQETAAPVMAATRFIRWLPASTWPAKSG